MFDISLNRFADFLNFIVCICFKRFSINILIGKSKKVLNVVKLLTYTLLLWLKIEWIIYNQAKK